MIRYSFRNQTEQNTQKKWIPKKFEIKVKTVQFADIDLKYLSSIMYKSTTFFSSLCIFAYQIHTRKKK
jgi:hypothetical protein